MNPCPSCGAGLADDQRYCLECGARTARLPIRFGAAAAPAVQRRFPRHWPDPFPVPSSAAALTAVVLGTGVLIGAAVGPTVTGTSSASQPRTTVLLQRPSQSQGRGQVAGAQAASLEPPAANVPEAPAPAPARQAAPAVAQAPLPAPPVQAAPAPAASTPKQPAAGRAPAQPPGTPVKGVVVHVNAPAHSYTLAAEQGQLIAVHAAHLPKAGDQLATRIHPLANGTFGQAKPKARGRGDTATLAGTVTFADPAQRIYTVSAPGASVLVRAVPAPAAGSPAPPQLPQPGQLVRVTVAIARNDHPAPGSSTVELREQKLAVEGTASGAVDLEGTVKTIDRGASTVTVSADDVRDSGQDIIIHVERAQLLDGLRGGEPIAASVRLGPGPSYTLVGKSDDSDEKSADSKQAPTKHG